jgi:hypothetical protein
MTQAQLRKFRNQKKAILALKDETERMVESGKLSFQALRQMDEVVFGLFYAEKAINRVIDIASNAEEEP